MGRQVGQGTWKQACVDKRGRGGDSEGYLGVARLTSLEPLPPNSSAKRHVCDSLVRGTASCAANSL